MGQLLGVVDGFQLFRQPGENPLVRKTERCGDDRPGQRAAACFIHASDIRETGFKKLMLVAEALGDFDGRGHKETFVAESSGWQTIFEMTLIKCEVVFEAGI